MAKLKPADLSRRQFLATAGIATAGVVLSSAALGADWLKPSAADSGSVKSGQVAFPELKSKFEKPSGPTPSPLPPHERIGFAVVALGRLSLNQILPAFAACKFAKLTALVSGTPDKAKVVASQYGIPEAGIYDYQNFDKIKDNPDVQAVYIVLPNTMHREFVERAAAAGKHVLCEKPMATNVADARAMISACEAAQVKLMIAYRCQYEPYNLEVMKRIRSGELGQLRLIEAVNTQSEGEANQWRLKRAMSGGGALPDIGIYCLNAARYLTGEEPDQVFAYMSPPSSDPRFKEVEERMAFMLRFPSGVLATCTTSYDAHDCKDYKIQLEKGVIALNGAFEYQGKQLLITHRADKTTSVDEIQIGEKDQFALEMDHFAECIKQDRVPRTPGEEGLQDQIIMEALYKSTASGQPVSLATPKKRDAFRGLPLKEKT